MLFQQIGVLRHPKGSGRTLLWLPSNLGLRVRAQQRRHHLQGPFNSRKIVLAGRAHLSRQQSPGVPGGADDPWVLELCGGGLRAAVLGAAAEQRSRLFLEFQSLWGLLAGDKPRVGGRVVGGPDGGAGLWGGGGTDRIYLNYLRAISLEAPPLRASLDWLDEAVPKAH